LIYRRETHPRANHDDRDFDLVRNEFERIQCPTLPASQNLHGTV
jgi:hypothetical protein